MASVTVLGISTGVGVAAASWVDAAEPEPAHQCDFIAVLDKAGAGCSKSKGKGKAGPPRPSLPAGNRAVRDAFLRERKEKHTCLRRQRIADAKSSEAQQDASICVHASQDAAIRQGEVCWSLGFEDGFFEGLDDRGKKHVRSMLFGHDDAIVQLLRAESPALELDLHFETGRIVTRNVDALTLKRVGDLLKNTRPDLQGKVAQIRSRMAIELRAAQLEEQRAQERAQNGDDAAASAQHPMQYYVDMLADDCEADKQRFVEGQRRFFERHPVPPAPVPQTLVELPRSHFQADGVVEVLPGRCWVVPAMLEAWECEDLIRRAQVHSMLPSFSARNNSRTREYEDLAMAELVWGRLPAKLLHAVEASAPMTAARSVHEQWRVSRYEPGQYFRAHYDESYTRGTLLREMQASNEHGEHGEKSSHTLLLILSDGYTAGATRFWPTGQYDQAIDVIAPKGWLLVFEQVTLLHEGCRLESGTKVVAQGALMRAPVCALSKNTPTFSTGFRFGPGVVNY